MSFEIYQYNDALGYDVPVVIDDVGSSDEMLNLAAPLDGDGDYFSIDASDDDLPDWQQSGSIIGRQIGGILAS